MKIINVSDKPYEFTFDSKNFPAIPPGGIAEYPDPIALHAIKRSIIYDEYGDLAGFKVTDIRNVPEDKVRLMAKFTCPMAQLNQCNAGPFSSLEELRAHLEEKHLGGPASSPGGAVSGSKPVNAGAIPASPSPASASKK